MIISFEKIPPEGFRWQGTLLLDQERLSEECKYPEPAEVEVEIYPVKNYFCLKGRIRGKAILECSRCLDEFTRDIDLKFDIYLVREPLEGGIEEYELKDEEMAFSYNHGEGVNLSDLFTEQVFLNLPMKLICSEDCAGLCIHCGANKNYHKCDCDSKIKNIDPRLEGLINIKEKIKH